VASLTDITELKDAERQIYFQAFHDTLTHLPNRALFIEHLTMAIKRSKRRSDCRFAVIYLDIDRFKLVNDSLGHGAGDDLLVPSPERIRESLRDTDVLARLGGDEFVILLEDIEQVELASEIAERLQKALRQPFRIQGKEVFAPASFGVGAEHPRIMNSPMPSSGMPTPPCTTPRKAAGPRSRCSTASCTKRRSTSSSRRPICARPSNKNQFQNYYQPIVRLDTASLPVSKP